MKKPVNIKKIMDGIKTQGKPPIVIKSPMDKFFPEKDMRQAAIDMGAHGAQEFWGQNERPV